MIIKTTGLVLRLDPYSKTSQVITWLTPHHGRIVTLAKGAKRPKSNLVGQYDCFYTCELLYYQARHSTVHILKECSPLSTRSGLRDDWRGALGASYLCALLNRLSPPGAASPVLYEWTESILDFIAGQGITETVLNWAELRLLKLLGMAPKLNGCLACRSSLDQGDRTLWFSIPRGGLLCATCATGRDALSIALPQDVLAILRGWERSESPLMAKRTTCTPSQIRGADRLLGAFLDYHLEPIPGRTILAGLI